MSVLSKEDFMSRLQTVIGEDTSDDAMSLIEDMSDTYNDLESRSTGEGDEAWQKKYDELDATWREKYKARFFETQENGDEAVAEQKENVLADGEERTFEDLFVEREG